MPNSTINNDKLTLIRNVELIISMSPDAIRRLLVAAEQSQRDEPALMRIIDELERRSLEEGELALWYAAAYAWYLHPRRLEDASIQTRVDELLHRVLTDSPSDYLSLLYLGHNKYDAKDYDTAKRYFERAVVVAPKSYIGLKATEMLACCKIMMEGAGAALDELEAFLREASASSYEKEDLWPRELVSALERRGMGDASPTEIAKAVELADRLDQLGQLDGWVGGIVRRASART